MYDPFIQGPFPIFERTVRARDAARSREFPGEIWSPEKPGSYPLILFSHAASGGRRGASFLCTHLASHGYIVAALDHSELVAPELAKQPNETAEEKAARVDAVIASRVPDVRFFLNHILDQESRSIDPTRIGIAGHSFGGWTALAAPDTVPQIRAVAALAPGGSSEPRPGILPVKLHFDWNRDIPTLLLAAENDVCLPLSGMHEIFERVPATKRMFVLRRADHMHFMDNVEQVHEAVRTMPPWSPELAYLQKEMRPMTELCSGEAAHRFTRSLTLAHFDSVLKRNKEAEGFLDQTPRYC